MMKPVEAGDSILQNINYILKTYPSNNDRIDELEKQLCDIQHQIELSIFDIQRGYRFAKQIQEIRKERRVLKDENELLRPIYEFLNQNNNKIFVNGFINLMQRAKLREKTFDDRIYSLRSEKFREEYDNCNNEMVG